MRVLVACEWSGAVRDAFRRCGHDAWSCDLVPCAPDSEFASFHIEGDVRAVIGGGWDMMIAFPECKFLSGSGLHWNKRTPGRAEKTEEALAFVRTLMSAPIKKKALENPVGCISTRIRRPDQIIQPYWFGADASKKTCLWLEGLPPLAPTAYVRPRYADGKPRWANQTDSGQNRLGPSDDRARLRGKTYPGVADAMAIQWGGINEHPPR